MKILLIGFGKYLSLFGIRYLSALLTEHGHETFLCFIPSDNRKHLSNAEIDSLLAYVEELNPDITGVSSMFCDDMKARRISEALKKKNGNPLVWGGLNPTLEPQKTPELVDYVCIGEGEKPFLRFIERLAKGDKTSDIPGIWAWDSKKQWIRNEPESPVFDLNSLPFPDYRIDRHAVIHKGKIKTLSHQLMKRYPPHSSYIHLISTSRGCPEECSFCVNSSLKDLSSGPYVRRMKPDKVIAEMQQVLQNFPELLGFFIADDLFLSAPQEWLEEFSEKYKKNIRLPFICEIHPKYVTSQNVRMLKEAGLAATAMGIQSFNERICNDIFNRKTGAALIQRSISILNTSAPEMNKYFDVIVDNPFETEDEFVETVEAFNRLPKNFELDIFPLVFYPGTRLTMQAESGGIKTEQPELLRKGENCRYSKTYLNRLLRTTPYARKRLVNFWLEKRKAGIVRVSFYLFYFGYFATIRKFYTSLTRTLRIRVLSRFFKDKEKKARKMMPLLRI